MNTPSPLVPQGATPPRGSSSFYFKFLMIVAVHVVVIGGMLLQGCKDTNPAPKDNTSSDPGAPGGAGPSTPTVDVPPMAPPVAAAPAPVPAMNPMPGQPTGLPPAPQLPLDTAKPVVDNLPSATGEKEYVIVEGDRLGAIAHKNGVTLKALLDANPGVDPKKLQINQKIHIPASIAVVATTHGAGATPGMDTAEGDSALYTVKSGDVLLKIARTHGTTVRKIMAMNDLKTTSIRAGQKLKMPMTASVTPAPATVPATATAPSTTPVTRASSTTQPVAAN